MTEKAKITKLYDTLTGDEDARTCKDIPESACVDLPYNFFLNLIPRSMSKIGDELASAKLVLPWLLSVIGAPAFLAGLLVPIRESGSLLPQLLVGGYIRRYAIRKWFLVIGSVLQGVAVLGMALVGWTLSGAIAGWAIIGLLVLFSLSRGISSVSGKDVLCKTVSKNRRGTLMGYAGLLAGLVTIVVGAYFKLSTGTAHADGLFFGMLVTAGVLWLIAAVVFTRLRELPGATEGGVNAFKKAVESLALLKIDAGLRHFILTRTMLLSTALVIPFYVILGREQTGGDLSGLGLMMLASGLAGSLSAPVWGRFADRSSRLVMVWSAVIAGFLGISVYILTMINPAVMQAEYTYAVFFLIMGIAHSGVRLGRKTYLIDMATPETRPSYVALSNTTIGVLILLGGVLTAGLSVFGTKYVILILACISLVAAVSALKLREVE